MRNITILQIFDEALTALSWYHWNSDNLPRNDISILTIHV